MDYFQMPSHLLNLKFLFQLLSLKFYYLEPREKLVTR